MQISDFQKNVIAKILDGKVFDILSFMAEYFDIANINSRADFETLIYNFRTRGISENLKINNINDAVKKLTEYFIICNFLVKENLVYKKSSENFINFHFTADFTDSKSKDDIHNLNSLLYKYPRDEYYPSPELADFIKNGYQLSGKNLTDKYVKRMSTVFLILTILYFISTSFFVYIALNPGKKTEHKEIRIMSNAPDSITTEKQIIVDTNIIINK